MGDGDVWFTSHINENSAEVDQVANLFPSRRNYLGTYAHHGLVGPPIVLAHNVHATDHELEVMADTGCLGGALPDQQRGAGQWAVPLPPAHRARRGGGARLGRGRRHRLHLLKEGLQAYFIQQLLGPDGLPLTPVHLLYLATRAGAEALGLGDQVGDLSVGSEFDAVWINPRPGGTFETVLRHAEDAGTALAKVFALGTPADVAAVWVGGRQRYGGAGEATPASSAALPEVA